MWLKDYFTFFLSDMEFHDDFLYPLTLAMIGIYCIISILWPYADLAGCSCVSEIRKKSNKP